MWRWLLWSAMVATILAALLILLFADDELQRLGSALMAAFFVTLIALEVTKVEWRPPFR
jgi:hypothetical protein